MDIIVKFDAYLNVISPKLTQCRLIAYSCKSHFQTSRFLTSENEIWRTHFLTYRFRFPTSRTHFPIYRFDILTSDLQLFQKRKQKNICEISDFKNVFLVLSNVITNLHPCPLNYRHGLATYSRVKATQFEN